MIKMKDEMEDLILDVKRKRINYMNTQKQVIVKKESDVDSESDVVILELDHGIVR